MSAKRKSDSHFENNPLAQAILREGLSIQDRFAAEPVYAKTGKGFLKSAGIEEIAGVASDEEARAFREFCNSLG